MIEWEPLDCFIATGTAAVIAGLAAAGASTTSAVLNAKGASHAVDVQSQATRDATAAQTQATREATAAQTVAQDKTLAYEREQAALAQQQAEANRSADYGQWAAREGRISSLGQQFGLSARQIPGYVPMPGTLGSIGGQAASASSAPIDAKAAAFIQQYQASHPVSEGIAPLADAMKQAGFANVSRYMYGATPSDNELNVGGQKYKVLGAENTPGAYWYKPGMNDSAPGGGGGSSAGAAPLYGSIGAIGPMTPAYMAPRILPRTAGTWA